MDFHGIPWNSIESCGILWNPMEFHRIPLNSIDWPDVTNWDCVSPKLNLVHAMDPCRGGGGNDNDDDDDDDDGNDDQDDDDDDEVMMR